MYLTIEEEKMHDGEYGPALEWMMRFLSKYGEALGAKKLIEISSAVIDWEPGFTIEKLPPFVISDLKTRKVKVPTYGLLSVDHRHWKDMGVSEELYKKYTAEDELGSFGLARKMGIIPLYTCAPYLVGFVPIRGTHCTAKESSLPPYLNSMLGVMTSQDTFPSCFASALVGKTPEGGLHLRENRYGKLLVKVETKLTEEIHYDMLAISLGKQTGATMDIPIFSGIPKNIRLEHMKSLCGGLSASTGVGMFHIIGVTPEARTLEDACGGCKPEETISVDEKELKKAQDTCCTRGSPKVDLVVLGCPHYSLNQVERVARLLEGKRVHKDVKLWIFMPYSSRLVADSLGLTDVISKSGGLLLCSTCPILMGHCPPGTEVMATDSAKQALLAKELFGIDIWFGSVEKCIEAAVSGEWRE
jgi:predicted aconitase